MAVQEEQDAGVAVREEDARVAVQEEEESRALTSLTQAVAGRSRRTCLPHRSHCPLPCNLRSRREERGKQDGTRMHEKVRVTIGLGFEIPNLIR